MTHQWSKVNKTLLSLLKALLLIVFIAFIPLLFIYEGGTSLLWTIVFPIIPILLLIIGYSNWRDICPLAFFSKISQKLTWIPKRKVPKWFERNFYFFQYGILIASFDLRLTLTNFDNTFLAIFLILVILWAFVTNLIFTGKSWCNFFCPVGAVEKIYSLSNAHNYNKNSACTACSACKINCPDIDLESNYWKESANKQKSVVFYSFSGLVLGFYIYFFLQSGSLSYYYSGAWTSDQLSFLSPGFYFAPFIPLFIAVPITLLLFMAASYYIFKGIENYLFLKRVFKDLKLVTLQHRMKVIAAFTAFNVFYIFAGAPAYQHYPLLYSILYFLIVLYSAFMLQKEFFREEGFFIQERFALKIIKKWDLPIPIPKSLKEIYYTYSNINKNYNEKLDIYKETIGDLLNEGILTQDSMKFLEKLRKQMGITERDHLHVIKNIKLKDQELFNADTEKTREIKYQRSSYKKMLEEALNEHISLDVSYMASLRKQFCITNEVHKQIMDDILNTNEKLHSDVLALLKQMNALRRVHKSILSDRSREIFFLKYVIRNEFSIISKDLFALLDIMYKDYSEDIERLKQIFKYKQIGKHIALDKDMLNFMDDKIAHAILELKKDFDNIKNVKEVSDNKPILAYLLENDSIYIAAASLMAGINSAPEFFETVNIDRLLNSEDRDIQELAKKIANKTDEITLYEAMMYLHYIPLFESIKFNELRSLAQSTKLLRAKEGEYIIKQGTAGNTLFIIISGEVELIIDGKRTDTLGDEDYFGEIALLGEITRRSSVKAISDVTILTLSKESFKAFVYENPKISLKLMKGIIHKLTDYQNR